MQKCCFFLDFFIDFFLCFYVFISFSVDFLFERVYMCFSKLLVEPELNASV